MDAIQKRLMYRATHRGTKEADRLMGGFAREYLAELNEEELTEFERVLDESDVDLMNWLTGKEDIPADRQNGIMDRLLNYTRSL